MKNNLIILGTFLVVSLGLLTADANATTYYVRLDGGTATQCNGTANVAYPGSGSGVACAFNHPAWALGTNGNSGRMAAGDSLIIDNIDHSTGSQAKYVVGYGMPNTVSANCNLYSPYDCTLNPPPSGASATAPTIIAGAGYASGCTGFNTRGQMAQLWGTESVKQVLNLSNTNNVMVQCLEITDHSNCGFRVGTPLCSENYNGSSNGTYGRNGIFAAGGNNLSFRWLDVHGFSNRNFLMGGQTDITMSYINMDAGYMSNWDGDVGANSYFNGTILLDHVKNRFAGCSEAYPRSASFNTADYSNCTDQNDNPPGYGDGLGAYNTGGNWIFTDSEFSHNAQDGLDLLYHDGTGSVTIQRSLFEGNDGNQLKVTSPNISIENSVILSNCNYHMTNNKVKNRSTWTSCRAGGDAAVFSVGRTGTYKIFNSTLYSEGSSNVLFVDRLGTCNGTETYNFKNNTYVGNGTSSLYINQLGGACAAVPLTTDYSIIKNVSNNACPSGAHNRCNTDPGWVSTISQTADSNVPSIALQATSPAIAAATIIPGASTMDFRNMDRGTSAWDIGAMQYATSGSNQTNLPVVSITSPANQSSFTSNSNITISANAYETNGTITNVSFYNGSALLGSDNVAPYSFIWNNVPAGSYTLTARATDANSAVTTSDPITVMVNAPLQPVVSLTNPTSSTTLTEGSNLSIAASASEVNGAIASVSFYNGSTLLGTSTNSPYTFNWSNIPAGNYTLTARATDLNSVSVTSNPVSITVNPASNIPPTVNLTAPAANASISGGPIDVVVSANALAAVGKTIARVEFFNGTAQLSYVGTTSPYTYTWRNVQPGSYSLTAKATDSTGLVTISSPINFTVTAATPPTVSMSAPANNSILVGPTNITLSANATASTGSTISRVEFFNGSNLLSTNTASPYSYTWNNVQPGIYSLTARATDSNGLVTTSLPISITIRANVAPTVSITTPNNNATIRGATVSLSASAFDSDGTIARVEFYSGNTRLNYTGTSSPYSYNWTRVRSGTYTITARATDNNGAVTTSAPITITVRRR